MEKCQQNKKKGHHQYKLHRQFCKACHIHNNTDNDYKDFGATENDDTAENVIDVHNPQRFAYAPAPAVPAPAAPQAKAPTYAPQCSAYVPPPPPPYGKGLTPPGLTPTYGKGLTPPPPPGKGLTPPPPPYGKGKTLTPPGLTPPMDLMMAMIAHMTQLEGQMARMEKLEGELEREVATLRCTVKALREPNSASGSGSGFEFLGHTEELATNIDDAVAQESTAAGDDSL